MAATFSQHTVVAGTLAAMFTAMETLAANMGFDPSEEYFRYTSASPYWLVYKKTNLTGVYADMYFGFQTTTTAMTLGLYSSFNTTTRTGVGAVATYGARSMTGTLIAGTTYRFDVWKDSDLDCKWGITTCFRSSDNIPFASPSGWCKFVPFPHFDANKAATSLIFSNSENVTTSFANMNTTGVSKSAGTPSIQPSIGVVDSSGRFTLAYGVLGGGICARNPDVDGKVHLVSPVVVGQGAMPYGYIDSQDLAIYSTPGLATFAKEDRLIVSAGVEEYEPIYARGCDMFVRIV